MQELKTQSNVTMKKANNEKDERDQQNMCKDDKWSFSRQKAYLGSITDYSITRIASITYSTRDLIPLILC